jgi:hypothetical protein
MTETELAWAVKKRLLNSVEGDGTSRDGLHPRLELGGHGGFEVHGLIVDGVMEAELPGV